MNRGLFETLKPMTSTNVEPYRHMTSGVILELARQTQAARQQSNNVTSIAYPTPAVAPYATLTNTTDTFDFKWNNERDCSIYHLMQNGHDTVDVEFLIAVRGQLADYLISLQYFGTGISSATQRGGVWTFSQSASMLWQIPGDLDDGGFSFVLTKRRIRIRLDTQPSDRVLRIVPRASKSTEFRSTHGALSQSDRVYLYHAMVTDYLRGPETE